MRDFCSACGCVEGEKTLIKYVYEWIEMYFIFGRRREVYKYERWLDKSKSVSGKETLRCKHR